MELRHYQTAAVDAIYDWFSRRLDNPLVVMPTGTGKSLTIAEFTRRAMEQYPSTRIVNLTHVKELIEQDLQALLRIWPDAPVGIYSAGLGRKDMHSRVLFAGIQSIHKKAYELQQCDLILIDEAHLIPRKSETMYGKFLAQVAEINPKVKMIGFTATPFRLDSGPLYGHEKSMFGGVAYQYEMKDAIKEGFLTELVSRGTATQFDTSNVRVRGGEFVDAELEKVFNDEIKNEAVVREIMANAEGRHSCLVFATGVDHANAICRLIRGTGKTAEVVTGDTSKTERASLLRRFKEGDIWALVNVNVLTTGFDAPGVDLIALVRATMSVGLYIQMCGRGTRLSPGKADCMILDFAQNIDRHGPVDEPNVKTPGEPGDGDAPVKICESCEAYNYAGVRVCAFCGNEFPPPESKYDPTATDLAVLSFNQQKVWLPVLDTSYHAHHKPGKPSSLRVTYATTSGTHREWVCLEHTGRAKNKAIHWWRERLHGPIPATVEDALLRADGLSKPKFITIRKTGKYSEITGHRF